MAVSDSGDGTPSSSEGVASWLDDIFRELRIHEVRSVKGLYIIELAVGRAHLGIAHSSPRPMLAH